MNLRIISFVLFACSTVFASEIRSPIERVAAPENAAAMGFTQPAGGEARERYDLVFGESGWSGGQGRFGYRIAVDGDRMLVTSLAKKAVYLYSRTPGGAWEFEKFVYRWFAGNPAHDVALADGFAMLGDPEKSVFASGLGYRMHGGAFLMPLGTMDQEIGKMVADPEGGVFEYSVGHLHLNWVRQGPGWLLGNTFQSGVMSGTMFGEAIAWDGETAVAGAPLYKTGAVTTGGLWLWGYGTTEVAWRSVSSATELVPVETLDAGAGFGSSVALRGGLIAAGAPGQGSRGSVFMFGKADAVWEPYFHVQAPGSLPAGARFGTLVAISGNTLAVSAPGPLADEATLQAGKIFIYSTVDPDIAPVEISPPETAFRFGGSLALDGDRLLIGAWGGATGSTGAAYLYQRDSLGSWHYKAKLAVPGLPVQARYGRAVALAGDEAHVSALTDSTDGANMGGVYRFGLSGITTEAVLSVTFPDPAPYDGLPRPVQYVISPSNLPVTVSYNGSIFAPTNAGTYPVTVSLNAPGYAPQTVSGSIVITQAEDSIAFGGVPVLDVLDGSFTLSMSTASGRVPAISSGAPGILTVSQGPPRLNPQGVGSAVVTASLPETLNFTGVESGLTVIVDDFRAVGRPPVVTPELPAAASAGLDQLGARVAIGSEYAAAARRKVPGEPRAVTVFRRLRNGQWVHFAELPLPPSTNNEYGHQLAVGGNVIAVGDASWANQVHLYEITPSGVVGPVSVPGGGQVSEMGWRPIALSEDGGYLFCAVKRGTSDPSGVRVYRRPNSGGQWPLHQTLVQGAADAVGTYYGAALATRDEVLAVSAPQLNSGLVFTYRRNPATGLFQAVNAVINESGSASFGRRLDLDGDRLLVSHPTFNGYGDGREGRVLIYQLDEGIPNSPVNLSTPEDVIPAPAGAMEFGNEAVFFGGRVAVKRFDTASGNPALAFHRRNGAVWEMLPAPALGDVTSYVNETTLASSAGGILMVGVPRGENAGAPAGSGRVVFLASGNETLITQGITPNFPGGSALTSVATFGSVIACGVDYHQEPGRFNQGKVFLFDANTGMEVPVQALVAATPRANGFFGRALALGGTHLAVAHFNGVVSGQVPVQVEIFRRGAGGDFVPVQTLTLSDAVPSGSVLMRMAMNDAPGFRTLVIGLPGAQAVHLFSFDEETGQWEFTQRIGDSSLGKYGDSVAIHGENVVIGGPGAAASDMGRVDRYRRNGVTGLWGFVQSLPIVDPAGTSGSFQSRNVGRSVAIGGDWIAVGSNQGTSPLITRVHFHNYQAAGVATHHSSVVGTEQFGGAMAAAGPYLMVGAQDANGMGGRATLYFREPFGWRELGRIEGAVGQTAFLGQTLAVGSRFAVAGHRIQPGTRDTAFRMLPLSSPSFAQWTQEFQLAGSQADPNGDPSGEGVPNLLRHVFGIPADSAVSAGDREKFPKVSRALNGDLSLAFSLPGVALDVDLVVEKSASLGGGWEAIAQRIDGEWSFLPGIDGTVMQTGLAADIDITLDSLADPRCFYRLKAGGN